MSSKKKITAVFTYDKDKSNILKCDEIIKKLISLSYKV